MSTIAIGGVAAATLATAFWAYLRIRVRQLEAGVVQTRNFSELARELAASDIGPENRAFLTKVTRIVGSGHVSNTLLLRLVRGEMNSPVTRSEIEENRRLWADSKRSVRIKFTQAVFTALLADSYAAGLRGTLFRRLFFYVSSSPAAIAEALDTFETKVLLVGAERAVESAETQGSRSEEDLVLA